MSAGSETKENWAPFNQEVLQKLAETVKNVMYGSVTLIIQDGKVIQIDKNEKLRLR